MWENARFTGYAEERSNARYGGVYDDGYREGVRPGSMGREERQKGESRTKHRLRWAREQYLDAFDPFESWETTLSWWLVYFLIV